MSELVWDQAGEKLYEIGVRKGVLFPAKGNGYDIGVAWNGLANVTESPSGADIQDVYADDTKYASVQSKETFGLTIEAYMYPNEFKACNGFGTIAKGVTAGQQTRKGFAFCWRSAIGSDTEGIEYGYKLKFAYGCLAQPAEHSNQTINESVDISTMSFEVKTTPVNVPGAMPSSLIVVDSTECDSEKLKALEAYVYGTADAEPQMPTPEKIIEIMGTAGVSLVAAQG